MIEITNEQIERVHILLSKVPNGAEKAFTSVIKRATDTVRTRTTKGISEVYAISQKDVRAESNITVKTQQVNGGIVGVVRFAGCKIPLYRFDVSPKKRVQGKMVEARKLRSEAKVAFEHAFIAKMKNPGGRDHIGMFERKEDSSRLPIKEIPGSSVPQMAKNSVVLEEVEQAAQETIEKRIEHEISRILNGYGR